MAFTGLVSLHSFDGFAGTVVGVWFGETGREKHVTIAAVELVIRRGSDAGEVHVVWWSERVIARDDVIFHTSLDDLRIRNNDRSSDTLTPDDTSTLPGFFVNVSLARWFTSQRHFAFLQRRYI